MAKSHQRGTVRLEHHSWVGYMNIKVLDPNTGESKWKKQRVGVLGPKSKMTKHQAQDSLDVTIAQKTGGTTQPRADERIATLGWFTRNRFFPLREGSTWKEETARTRKSAIELDILAKFGDVAMEQIDKFMLQTHLNDLARILSAGRVMHARFYMKAIFEEAIDQDFVKKNPARKLILPTQLRPVDKTTLTWDQLRLVLASVPLRDRILLTLDMTETFRPSELFALRWSGFDMDNRTLTVSQTAFRGKLRDWGKTKKSLRTVHLPEGLANDLWLWKQECPDASPDAYIFPNSRKRNGAKKNGFIRTDNYRARVLKKLAEELGLSEAELPGAAPHDCDAGPNQGEREGRAGHPGTQQGRHHRQCLHAADRGRRETDAGCDLRGVDGAAEAGSSFVNRGNLVRFGTVGILDVTASDRLQRLGRLTQR